MNNYLARSAKKLFLDSIKVRVQGGTGGNGLPQFGGIGGKGGDVYITGSTRVHRLDSVLKSPLNKAGWYKAQDGRPALRTQLLGTSGQDININVPVGVTVTDSDNQLLGEINGPKDKVIVAYGGRGGDKFSESHGFQGQKRSLLLDYKLISDAVFVGFPNAGKSSLLRAVSNATPKVANYPFTTLRPYLGVVQFDDFRKITMADLPGLVEGAHKNLGLGHEFLKHIVRSRVLIFVIDVDKVDLGPSYVIRSPIETLCILNKEIELYDDTLLKKPAILAISKVDSFRSNSNSMKRFEKFKEDLAQLQESKKLASIPDDLLPSRLLRFDDVLPISSLNKLGIARLKQATRDVIDKYEEAAKAEKDNITSYKELQPLEFNRIIQ